MAAHILTKKDTILFVSIRLGKTRVALKAVEEGDKILVVYPFKDIKKSWLDELEKFSPKSSDITFVTKNSVHKYAGQHFDYLVIDEPQLCQSAKQVAAIKSISYKKRVGLTGTLNQATIKKFQQELNWHVGVTYTIADAIRDKLVKDYEIIIHFVELDDIEKNIEYTKFKRQFWGTEKEVYNSYTDSMIYFELMKAEAADPKGRILADMGYKKYMGLRTNFLYNTPSLYNYAQRLAEKFAHEKVLIYTLRTDIADALSDTSYHSKNKETEVLEEFKNATSGHLAVVNCVQAGVTIKYLNKVLFHSYESNTEVFYQKLGRSLLYEFEGEKSEIHIVCLKDTQMERWIDSACRSLEQNKIYYVFNGRKFNKLGWIKAIHPDKQLFLYNGSVVFYQGKATDGFPFDQYSFLESPDRRYNLSSSKLIRI
jgi:superfamily II DNA or RNA helicase